MKIKVGVMASNAGGEPDLFFTEIVCTEDQYSNGRHYEIAKERAEKQGFEPSMAFDENDPAWSAFEAASASFKPKEPSQLSIAQMAKSVWGNPIPQEAYAFAKLLKEEMVRLGASGTSSNPYRAFFDDALLKLQGAFLGDGDCNGGDLVDLVAELFRDSLASDELAGHMVFMCLSEDGFYNGDTAEYTVEPSIFLDAQRASELANAGWPVVSLPVATLAFDMPDADDLENAADSAISRSEKHHFSIGQDNAAEVIREELILAGFVERALPSEFNAVLEFAMLRELDEQREAPGERG